MDDLTLGTILQFLLLAAAISLGLALLLGVWVWRNVHRFRLPPEATFIEAMRLTPLSVVVLLDLLDLGLDIFSAPVAWAVLSRLGLTKLRAASALQALVPGSQMVPTMTLGWFLVRLFGPRLEEIPYLEEALDRGSRKRLQDIPKRYRA